MSYKALYRKYRPSTFDEVYGQKHIVATLKNAVENDRLAHAYLFCGPRGTGKTSTAKLLAKTINCTGENKPCGKCENCLDIQNSTHPDVIELDGATNNGVDEIRDLVDRVKYAPMQGKYKVYIIDEVHMITANAFNALLKTLEEPPEYCIFILCTTEPHKVLPTIVSRCQRFDFNKIGINVIQGRLKEICHEENIDISDAAVRIIAELAEGGLRDALSILDQCIAYSPEHIEEDDVLAVYGIATTKEKLELFRTVSEKDVDKLISMVNSLSNRGTDLQRLTLDLINMAKEAVIFDYSHNRNLLEKITDKQAQELLDQLDSGKLLRCIDCLMDVNSRYATAIDGMAYFEVAFLKMMENISNPGIMIETPKTVDNIIKEPEIPAKKGRIIKKLTDDEFLQILRRSRKDLKQQNSSCWNSVLNNYDARYGHIVMALKGAEVMAESPDELIIVVNEKIIADSINDMDQLPILEELIEKEYGTHKKTVCITRDRQNALIKYFRAKQKEAELENGPDGGMTENIVTDATIKLKKLFGAEGFEETED